MEFTSVQVELSPSHKTLVFYSAIMVALHSSLTAIVGIIMSNLIHGNQKHLTQQDREYMKTALDKNTSFKDIAKFLCKDSTTISKEIRLHRVKDTYYKGSFIKPHNFCTKRFYYKKRMHAIKSNSMISNVLLVLNAIKFVTTLFLNIAQD